MLVASSLLLVRSFRAAFKCSSGRVTLIGFATPLSLTAYTASGVQYGVFKTAGHLSFLNVFNAGHEVPAYCRSAGRRDSAFWEKRLIVLCMYL
ncbi:hypothetical protein EDB85DRAFT_890550 [Lactarius pseudohatsudake]|nr:hypothetical protein EDB85DRAFT_890550 [Lactarius pseudohatsudake]